MSHWSKPQTDLLRTSWTEGKSAAACADEIFQKLGTEMSRSAVCGKIFRLGLSNCEDTMARRKAAASARARRANNRGYNAVNQQNAVKLFATASVLDISIKHRKTFSELHEQHCRWPITGEAGTILFCGGDRLEPYSYCAGHCRAAFR